MGFTGRPRGRVLASSIIIDAWVSDGWRWLGGLVCDNRPVRQDLLDEVVWKEVVRLLEDKSLIEGELDRRLKAARNAEKTRCVAISRIAENASSACSRPIKKAFSPLKSYATECPICAGVNRHASWSCRRSKINRRSGKSACASPNPS